MPGEGKPRGFLQHVAGLYLSPAEAFAAILKTGRSWLPIALLVALNLAFTAVWLRQVDPMAFLNAQAEEAGRPPVPAESQEAVTRFFTIMSWLGGVVGAPLLLFVVSGVYALVFGFFIGSELRFGRCLAVVAHAFLAVTLVTTPLALLSLFLKNDWTVDPRTALQANLALVLDRGSSPKLLYALADSLDLFSFWLLFLLYVGFRQAVSASPRTVALGVLAPWAIYVLGRALLAGVF